MNSRRWHRRELISLLSGAAVAWPLAAPAQQADRMRLISLSSDDPDGQARSAAFLQGLRQSGWTEGRNVRIDHRWGGGIADNFRKYAAELAALGTMIWRIDRTGWVTREISSIVTMGQVMLLVYAYAGHPYQSDMHMYFFAMLAVLAGWLDWRIFIPATLAIILHHLAFSLLQPSGVFLNGNQIDRVLLHGAIVAVQSVALSWVTTVSDTNYAMAWRSRDLTLARATAPLTAAALPLDQRAQARFLATFVPHGSAENARGRVDRVTGIGGRANELAAGAHADIETFPIETSSFIDRLRGGRDDEVGGLSTTSEQRGSSHTERKRTYKHILHSHRVNRSRPTRCLSLTRVTTLWSPNLGNADNAR